MLGHFSENWQGACLLVQLFCTTTDQLYLTCKGEVLESLLKLKAKSLCPQISIEEKTLLRSICRKYFCNTNTSLGHNSFQVNQSENHQLPKGTKNRGRTMCRMEETKYSIPLKYVDYWNPQLELWTIPYLP